MIVSTFAGKVNERGCVVGEKSTFSEPRGICYFEDYLYVSDMNRGMQQTVNPFILYYEFFFK